MAKHLRQFSQDDGVVFIGKAQEKTTPVFRTERRTTPKTGQTYGRGCAPRGSINNGPRVGAPEQ
jgi:hypothetical protein